ncbi:predicted protein [Lichtheimia corymbifera JMRC:FSU:9682]|uniref:Uncharacterized protein n=1 Tax=Lichtheimia corymbifera JMRC:FSU:9682 TaxID=1263082 RepID=A0A068S9H8_9FUNG|nr:predicted protein [Lichtheimia corymbifera JMRC:FSU:9682]
MSGNKGVLHMLSSEWAIQLSYPFHCCWATSHVKICSQLWADFFCFSWARNALTQLTARSCVFFFVFARTNIYPYSLKHAIHLFAWRSVENDPLFPSQKTIYTYTTTTTAIDTPSHFHDNIGACSTR